MRYPKACLPILGPTNVVAFRKSDGGMDWIDLAQDMDRLWALVAKHV